MNGRWTTPFPMLTMAASKKRHRSRSKEGSAYRREKRKGTTVALPKTARKKRAEASKANVKETVAVKKMQGVKLFLPHRHKEMMLVELWVVAMVRVFIVHAPVFLAQFYRCTKRATIVVMMGEEH